MNAAYITLFALPAVNCQKQKNNAVYSTSPVGILSIGNRVPLLSGLKLPIPFARLYKTLVRPPLDSWTIALADRHKKSSGTERLNSIETVMENNSDSNGKRASSGN